MTDFQYAQLLPHLLHLGFELGEGAIVFGGGELLMLLYNIYYFEV